MSKLLWDQAGDKRYETGIEQVALFKKNGEGYGTGVAWNGITALNITPSGAEPTALYANDAKYITLMSAEDLGGTIEAYTYPDEWKECDGSAELAAGVYVGQQARVPFGLVGKSLIGDENKGTKKGYVLHIIYGAMASPSEQAHTTVNDSPEATTMSWEFSTTPVAVTGMKPTSYISIDSTKADPTLLAALEAMIYGSDSAEPTLPLPDEIKTMMTKQG